MQHDLHLKNKISELLQTPVSACTYERDFVLSVTFAECLDLDRHLVRTHENCFAFPEIQELSEISPVIILNNAAIAGQDMLSNPITGPQQTLDAHFFHRDLISNDPGFQMPATIISSPEGSSRQAATYYARENAVRSSVDEITKSLSKKCNDAIQAGLKELPYYGYSVVERDIQIYQFLNATLGSQFTENVYDNIDDKDKYAVDWTTVGSKCVLGLNMTDIMHARPASQDTTNPNVGLDIEFT